MTICPRCGKPGDFKVYADGTQSVNCVRCLEYQQRYRAGTLPVKQWAKRNPVRFVKARTNTTLTILGK